MAEQLRSPRSPTPLAAAVPARFAEECDTRWRELEGGELEVATLRDGLLERHRVHADGTTTVLDSGSPELGRRWGRKVAIGGWLLCPLGGLLMVAGYWWGVVMFGLGMALMVLGGTVYDRTTNLDRVLARRGDGPWFAPARLSGWVPASTEQLATVEQLADDHDGVAYVHDLGARSTEVLVLSKQSADRYWVDDRGGFGLLSTAKRGGRRRLVGALGAVWFPLVIAGFVARMVVDGLWGGILLFGGIAAAVAAIVAANTLDRSDNLAGRVRRLGDGARWVEIRTRVPDDDGD